nr:methyl-accepting chemotaxis protein [Pseudomonas sp. BSw22131]
MAALTSLDGFRQNLQNLMSASDGVIRSVETLTTEGNSAVAQLYKAQDLLQETLHNELASRGFAVVADEVRTPASRTQTSTEEIRRIIQELQHNTKAAVDQMTAGQTRARDCIDSAVKASTSLTDINEEVERIVGMNTQIASAAVQQHAVSEDINRNVIEIRNGSMTLMQGVEDNEVTADELSLLAGELRTVVARFKW